MTKEIKPFLKWAGGKRQLVSVIDDIRTSKQGSKFGKYYEPFVGAGAYLFHLQPTNAVINDLNEELINTYNIIKKTPDKLIAKLKEHQRNDEKLGKDYYYKVREWDKNDNYLLKYDEVDRAARIIYLNKRCYNGLYRVNSKGQFNVPFNHSKKSYSVDEVTIREVSRYFNKNNIKFLNVDYANAVKDAERGDLIYFDPPYFPESSTSSFDKYTPLAFGRDLESKKDEQIRLKQVADELAARGCIVIISNSNTEFINNLYMNKIEGHKSDVKYFIVKKVEAKRMINSKYEKRNVNRKNEVIIINQRVKVR